MTVIKAWIELQ